MILVFGPLFCVLCFVVILHILQPLVFTLSRVPYKVKVRAVATTRVSRLTAVAALNENLDESDANDALTCVPALARSADLTL